MPDCKGVVAQRHCLCLGDDNTNPTTTVAVDSPPEHPFEMQRSCSSSLTIRRHFGTLGAAMMRDVMNATTTNLSRTKKKTQHSIAGEIEQALKPGRLIRYDDMFEFVRGLEAVQGKLGTLVENNDAEQAVTLYEIFLSGCQEKAEECDDSSGNLGMFFTELFCEWVKSRQVAECPAVETVRQILNWKEHDDYGFCHRIDKHLAKVLDRDGCQLLVAHFQRLIEKALPELAGKPTQAIFDYSNEVRLPALSLKDIYQEKGDVRSYAELCERLGFSPKDCECLAELEISMNQWSNALGWVEKGLALEPVRNWHNEASHSLANLKPKILGKLGRKDDALAMAWIDFENHPSEFTYEDFMHYVPRGSKAEWHQRAMKAAGEGDLGPFMTLCVKTKEWERLAIRIHSVDHAELEAVSHYDSEPAADGLAKRDGLAAAKICRALCLRILNSKKSKYYDAALRHLRIARDLYVRTRHDAEWKAIVEHIRTQHSRKIGFMRGFDRLVAGESENRPSFVERAQKRWRTQMQEKAIRSRGAE